MYLFIFLQHVRFMHKNNIWNTPSKATGWYGLLRTIYKLHDWYFDAIQRPTTCVPSSPAFCWRSCSSAEHRTWLFHSLNTHLYRFLKYPVEDVQMGKDLWCHQKKMSALVSILWGKAVSWITLEDLLLLVIPVSHSIT